MEEVTRVVDHSAKTDGCKDAVKDQQPLNEKCKRKRSHTRSKPKASSKQPRLLSNNKSETNQLHKLDHSDHESCNPSYMLILEDDPILEASQSTEMEKQVLNDQWVSITCRGHNGSFKEPTRSKHEEILFRLEDDRMDIEVHLENINVTIKHAEELIGMIDAKTVETDDLFPLEDYFPGPSLGCIKTLYGKEYGVEIVKRLRKNVSFVLQVVLVRLRQKQEELKNWCSKFKELL